MDILLVEDSSSDAYLIRELVARRENAAEIHWVVDGYYALDYIFQRKQYQSVNRPDIILLDLNLPRISGYEVLKELKDNDDFSTIPVIILTTSRDPLDHTQCKALGADMCLSKPHALKEFDDMIQCVLDWTSLRLPNISMGNGSVH